MKLTKGMVNVSVLASPEVSAVVRSSQPFCAPSFSVGDSRMPLAYCSRRARSVASFHSRAERKPDSALEKKTASTLRERCSVGSWTCEILAWSLRGWAANRSLLPIPTRLPCAPGCWDRFDYYYCPAASSATRAWARYYARQRTDPTFG